PGLFQNKHDAPIARFFDKVMNGSMEAIIQHGLDTPPGPPLTGDVGTYSSAHNLSQTTEMTAEGTTNTSRPSRHPGRVSALSSTAPPWTFSRMAGDYVIEIFEMESNGTIDADACSWSWADVG